MNAPALIAQYGYFAVLFGIFLEGEMVLLTAGFLAYQGYLRIEYVLLIAFVGTLCSDQLYYYLGRTHGVALLERPRFRNTVQPVQNWLHRSGALLVAGFRFLYGLRIVTPLILGASRYPFPRFIGLNALGAMAWVLVIGLAGYWFGQALESTLAHIRHYEVVVLLTFVAVGIGVAWFARRKLRRAQQSSSDEVRDERD